MATKNKNKNQASQDLIRFVKNFSKPYFAFLINKDLEIIVLNKAAVKLTNKSKKGEIEGNQLQKVMSKKYFQDFSSSLKSFFQDNKKINAENSFLFNGQDEIIVDTLFIPVQNEKGETNFALCILKDITELKKKYREAKEAEDKFRYLFENSQNVHFGISSSAKIIEINQTALNLLGYKREEVIGKKFRKFVPFKYVPVLLKDLAIEMASGKTEPITIEVKHKNGNLIPIDLYPGSVPIYDEKHKEVGIMVTGIDRSSKSKMEKELELSEKRFELLFNNLGDGLAYFKPIYNKKGEMVDSEYLEINKAFSNFINYPRTRVIGKKISNIGPKIKKEWLKELGRVVKTGEHISFEMYESRNQKYYEVRAFRPKKNTYATIFRDVTQQKRGERIMRIQRDLSVSFGEVSSFKKAADIFLNKIKDFEEIDGGGLYIFDDDGNLELVKSVGLSKEFVNKIKKHKPTSTQVKLVKKGESIFTNYEKVAVNKEQKRNAEKIKSLGIIPLKDKEEIIGCLNIISKNFENFHDDTIQVLETTISRIEGVFSRIRKEKIIRTSEEKYKILAETQKEGVAIVNKKCVIQYANIAMGRLLGCSNQEIVGKNLQDFLASSSSEKVMELCKKKMEKGEIDSGNNEFNFLTKDNDIIIVEISSTPIYKNKKITSFHLTVRDITERKKAEESLKQKVEELEQINRLLVGRELKMVELKKRLARAERRLQEE